MDLCVTYLRIVTNSNRPTEEGKEEKKKSINFVIQTDT